MQVIRVEADNLVVRRAVGHTRAAGHFTGAPIFSFSQTLLNDRLRLMTDTIVCGRVGTAMPAWGQDHNGPLSDEQIRQLMVVITGGRWETVQREVDHEDEVNSHLTAAVDPDTISVRVTDVTVFMANEVIRLGEERLRVVAVPTIPPGQDPSGIIQVERGVRGSFPMAHSQETEIFRYPLAPEPTILQTSCGQTARPAAPAGTPGLIEPFEGQTVELIAQNVLFDTNQITVNANGQVRIRLDNRDVDVEHNVAVYQSRTNLTPVAPGSVGLLFDGPGVDDTVFDIPSPGSYFFRCDVHPITMTGTFTVR
jgi:plastocyanin